MKRALAPLVVSFSLVALAAAQLPAANPPRAWKTAEGQPFQAAVDAYDGTTVTLRLPNGAQQQAPATKLSAEDRKNPAVILSGVRGGFATGTQ